MRKLIFRTRSLVMLVLILTFYNFVFSQIETNSVPAKWEYYSGKDKKVSFLMPRLPVYVPSGNQCEGESGEIYAAYNDGVVYRLDIISKIEPPKLCSRKKDFDENNFLRRVKALKTEFKDASNSQNNISGNSIIKLGNENKIVKLINDYEDKRWFELSVYAADETKAEVKNFLASLNKDSQSTGIAIGPGAPQTFGDEVSADNSEVRTLQNIVDVDGKKSEENATEITIKTKDLTAKNFVVAVRQKASYTEDARRNRIQGKVVLKVTFMANGAVGAITPIRELPDGLTEAAIKAARKIVFVPPQKDGVRLTVSKTVEFSFAIY